MKDQLTRLATAAASPGISIQITRPSLLIITPAFTLLTLAASSTTPGISCSQAPAGHLTIARKHDTLTATRALLATLTRTALTPAESRTLVAELATR
jgi:hypothetical protein